MNPYAAPASERDLAGLPRCVMLTAEFDPLRDEAEEYAARLEALMVSAMPDQGLSSIIDYPASEGL